MNMLMGKQHVSSSLEPVWEAALRLRNDPAMRPFLQYLRDRREKNRDVCEATSGDQAARAGGRAQELKELLDLIEKAPSLLEQCRPAPGGSRMSQP